MQRASCTWLGLALLAAACEPRAPLAPSSPASPPPPAPAPPSVKVAPQAGPAVVDQDFLRTYAETRRFTRGTPQKITLTSDGRTALFLRSPPRTTVQSLWEMDVATGAVRETLTPASLASGPEHLSAEERARRERMRVTASGFTSFELSPDGTTLVVPLAGALYVVDRASGKTRALATGKGAIVDPHLSPDGKLVAYVQSDDVMVLGLAPGERPRVMTHGGTADHPHGLADFAASEELDRFRGFWWSPDSRAILFEDADATALPHFVIADPGHPDALAERVAYPRAGTVNAVLRFGIVQVASPAHVTWLDYDHVAMPYVASAFWDEGAPPCLVALDRLQKNEVMLAADAKTGKTREVMREHDDAWVNAGGSGLDPSEETRWLPDGSAFLWWSERDGDGRLGLVAANASANANANVTWLTPKGTQVTALLDLDAKRGVAIVETTRDALHSEADVVKLDGSGVTPLVKNDSGATFARFHGHHDVFLTRETSLDGLSRWMVRSLDGKVAREVPSVAIAPTLPHVELEDVGPDAVHVAIVRPRNYVPGAKYPIVDAAYAGPHVNVVALDARALVLDQWMADATGAIVVAMDTRGTPGRGRAWERAIAGKLGDVPLEGHVEIVRELAARHPEMDGARVGVYGASFGGYFSALAAMRHPEIYAAAVAIAPVTDWRNYDTAYTERYMGLPGDSAGAASYDSQSVVVAAARPRADASARATSLLIVHGTADDNVYFFNSLQLVDALAKADRPFKFTPLIGQTHQLASPDAFVACFLAAAETLQRGLALR